MRCKICGADDYRSCGCLTARQDEFERECEKPVSLQNPTIMRRGGYEPFGALGGSHVGEKYRRNN
jgi:hypothetical protein